MRTKALTDLLDKEMDRKEFLFYIGLLLLAITGISSFLKRISDTLHPEQSQTHGFGSGVYGGVAGRGKDVS